ncbi:hypothetical protein [Desertivirga arenae]|uniref:hypothetical protein n=1 Tax=Desertivirga arenae TaxID=2810309 RepID=UPI001A97BE44|nr:hypothetical protein [Pedobacter sp. SYSU D00823]
MIFAKLINIKDHIDGINTSESHSERTYLGKSYLIIPFINIDFLHGKFLELKNYSRVEFAYLLLQNVRKIEWAETNSDGSKIVGRKIFATKQPEDKEDYFAINDKLYLTDFENNEYLINFDGITIE